MLVVMRGQVLTFDLFDELHEILHNIALLGVDLLILIIEFSIQKKSL